MYKSLNNKVALVTGAGTGIGRAIAQRLADEGANVLIVGRTETTLVETAAYSDKISYLAIDLESEDGIRTIIRTVGERYGRLDILVNNAGWAPVTPFATMKIDEYDKVFAINVRAVVMLTQAFLPMIKAAKGNILNVTTNYDNQSYRDDGELCRLESCRLYHDTCMGERVGKRRRACQFTRRGAHRNPYLRQDRAFGRGRESPQGYGNEERASR